MRRTTKVGAAAASLALLLAACSSGSETATEGSAPASSAPAAGSGTFTIWADEVRTAPIKAECDKFAEANGITCEVVQIDFGDIRAKVVQGNQTGDVPDLFIGAHDWLGELVTNGVVTPFDLGSKSARLRRGCRQGRGLRRQELRRALRGGEHRHAHQPQAVPRVPGVPG